MPHPMKIEEQIDYDPQLGTFTWKIRKGPRKPGSKAGCFDKEGYRLITVNGKLYRGGRLAWFLMTGKWPKDQIDHIDRNPSNDCWNNLREATSLQNTVNRKIKSKYNLPTGVRHWGDKFQARIRNNGKRINLGFFDTAEEAHQAYINEATKLHGNFIIGG